MREIDALIGQPVLAQARPPSAETQGLLEEAARKQQVLRAEVESLRGSVDGTPDSTRSDEAARATARALEGRQAPFRPHTCLLLLAGSNPFHLWIPVAERKMSLCLLCYRTGVQCCPALNTPAGATFLSASSLGYWLLEVGVPHQTVWDCLKSRRQR